MKSARFGERVTVSVRVSVCRLGAQPREQRCERARCARGARACRLGFPPTHPTRRYCIDVACLLCTVFVFGVGSRLHACRLIDRARSACGRPVGVPLLGASCWIPCVIDSSSTSSTSTAHRGAPERRRADQRRTPSVKYVERGKSILTDGMSKVEAHVSLFCAATASSIMLVFAV